MENLDFLSAKVVAYLYRLVDLLGVAVLASVISFAMASARTKSKNGKIDWLEASMCSMMTIGIWSVLGKLDFSIWGYHLQERATIGVGVLVGFVGTNYLFGLIDKAVKKHFKDNESNGNE